MAIDYEAIFGVEEYDPCAALMALRPQYMRLMAGEAEVEIRYRDRTVKMQEADKSALASLISQLEGECNAKRGRAPRRFAITATPRQL